MKKNSCTLINPKKYSCYGLKNIRTSSLITKKNSCGSKIPLPPITFLRVRPKPRAIMEQTLGTQTSLLPAPPTGWVVQAYNISDLRHFRLFFQGRKTSLYRGKLCRGSTVLLTTGKQFCS